LTDFDSCLGVRKVRHHTLVLRLIIATIDEENPSRHCPLGDEVEVTNDAPRSQGPRGPELAGSVHGVVDGAVFGHSRESSKEFRWELRGSTEVSPVIFDGRCLVLEGFGASISLAAIKYPDHVQG